MIEYVPSPKSPRVSVAVQKLPCPGGPFSNEIIFRIFAAIGIAAITNLKVADIFRTAIDQVMSHFVRTKPDAHSRGELIFALIGTKGRTTLEDVDEFLLIRVAVQQGRLHAGRQNREIHAISCETESITQRPFLTASDPIHEMRGIVRLPRSRWDLYREDWLHP